MSDRPVPDQRRRDDLLEALFWLQGEGLESRATPTTLAALTGTGDEEALRPDLRALEASGCIDIDADGRCALTEDGHREAGRRFAESFADVIGKQGHGLCDDDCDCHDSADAAAECHQERVHHH